MEKKLRLTALFAAIALFTGCSDSSWNSISKVPDQSSVSDSRLEASVSFESEENTSESENISEIIKETSMDELIILKKAYKAKENSNPIMTQAFGADPFAMVFEDTVYIYMTADTFEYDTNNEITRNTYSKINTIHCVSTKDFKNFEDHGEIPVAGANGIAKWAHNSWAPAAAHKVIDGKDKFFLYFADNGGGIGVLTADSPTGPFTDPLGKALISRDVPTCKDVLWLFDPAVLVDDDGTGYLYFGGGVPEGKADFPGTGRVVKLGDNMISLDGSPVAIDIPALFEDSGIHKYNGKYYYSYCTNWSVPEEITKEYGITNGQIATMVSDSPMGPFTFSGKILDNPGTLCGLWGNNHHAVFSFKDKLYIVYHSRYLEKQMGVEQDYRITFVNEVTTNEDGTIQPIKQDLKGPDQLCTLDPYEETSAVLVSQMCGTNSEGLDSLGYGQMVLSSISTGAYTEVIGADFTDEPAKSFKLNANIPSGEKLTVYVHADDAMGETVARLDMDGIGSYKDYTVDLRTSISGIHNIFFVFSTDSTNCKVRNWKFTK